VLLDHLGRQITRRKQFGYLRGPVEYVLAEPEPTPDIDLCDAIGATFTPTSDDDDEDYIDSPNID
jgi:hypothetical protein